MNNDNTSTQALSGRLSKRAPVFMRVTAVLIWRAFQGLVVAPATIAWLFLAVGIAINAVTMQDIVQGFYDHSEQSRTARPGFVSYRECADPSSTNQASPLTQYKAPLLCQSWKVVEMPISEVVTATVAIIRRIYGILVIFSFGALFAIYPGRRFVGLAHQSS